jgi:hypothetical protein
MNIVEMQDVVKDCYFPGYSLVVATDGRGDIYLQANYTENDVDSGKPEQQFTRRWFLSPEMTKSEIVQTVFKCLLTSAEHRVREWFKYRYRPVFGPHCNVDALWEACMQKDERRAQ